VFPFVYFQCTKGRLTLSINLFIYQKKKRGTLVYFPCIRVAPLCAFLLNLKLLIKKKENIRESIVKCFFIGKQKVILFLKSNENGWVSAASLEWIVIRRWIALPHSSFCCIPLE